MLKLLASLTVAFGCCVGFASQGFAQTATSSCKPEIISTGHGAILDKAGPEKAIASWRNDVISRYGVFYGDPTKANSGKGVIVTNCARTLLGLLVCQAKGAPCVQDVSADTGGTDPNIEIPCDPRLKYCDPTVKWVQSRLNIPGSRLAVDGVAGAGTAAAIRNFRRTAKLPDGTGIDNDLINALKV